MGDAGYLAAGEGAGLGVIVIAPPQLDVCDRLAAEGFTALVPSGRDLPAAVDFLVEHPAVRGHGVAVVGYGEGGGLALWLAGVRPGQVRAVVPFYGSVSSDAPPDWDRITADVEGHYASEDEEAARAIEHELVSRGRQVRLFLYPVAAFLDDEDAARQAWVRTLEFLRAKLG